VVDSQDLGLAVSSVIVPGCDPSRFANDKFRLEDEVRSSHRFPFKAGQEHLGCGAPHVIGRLPHGRERHENLLGEGVVVVADDRYVIGDSHPGANQLVQYPDGHEVTGRE
jgi:hypothetical protein